MTGDPQRHAQQVIDIRLTLPAVGGMQISRELQRSGGLLPGGRIREPGDLGGEPELPDAAASIMNQNTYSP
jgi:hypothetical protein